MKHRWLCLLISLAIVSCTDRTPSTASSERVINRVQIVSSARIPDSTVEESVRHALATDPVVERHDIRVQVRNGLIRLDGTFDSYYERDHAEQLAARTAGAADVANRLRLTTDWRWRPDYAIVERLDEKLVMSPYVIAANVQVSSNDAEVVLRGEVLSWRGITAAVENAFDAGAKRVRNCLHLPGETPANTVHGYRDRRFWW